MKRLVNLVLSFVLLIGCMGLSVQAEEIISPKVIHTYTATEDFASDDWSTALRGAYLLSGTSCIARKSTSLISISGATNATQTCDKVRLTLYVERSTSYATGYGNYRTFTYSADDEYQIAKEISNISVERGYYYRVKGVHSVTHNGVTETTNSVTDPISYK